MFFTYAKERDRADAHNKAMDRAKDLKLQTGGRWVIRHQERKESVGYAVVEVDHQGNLLRRTRRKKEQANGT